ncbi:peptidoglycan-binding protein [Auraticoccus cholistanensis]|uniref:peptidoglycan-binding protein n=1 Tax=Auraticoccus cholistanensis TaxID=2656650 RepID=UPI0018D2707C|nr:peptidoglycan-binding protein [Auraticoccus cholistanensis]
MRTAGVAVAGLAGAGGLGRAAAAVQETSQNGWPAASDLPRNRDFAVDGVLFPSGVAHGAPDVILGYVARQFAATVEPLVDPGCWGFSYRPVTGGTSLSNHASGTAIDINAPQHPYGASGTFTAAQVSAIRAILSHCDGVVRWGGDYSSTKDEMHFELNRPPGAEVDALVQKLGGTPQPPARPTISEGDTGQAVRDAQTLLNQKGGYGLVVDGVFGPATTAAVRDIQARNGLTVDGVVGPRTWAVLDA